MNKNSRRDFLRNTGTALGGTWLATQTGAIIAAASVAGKAMADESGWAHLEATEAATLSAVADQIFPPDDTPGAAEIGAVHFMDAALGGFMGGALPMIREGIQDLDRRGMDQHGHAFADLEFDQQSELIRAVESSRFFGTVHFMTVAGCFALPSHGGNIDKKGWEMLGFEARHVWQPPFGEYDAQYAREKQHAGS